MLRYLLDGEVWQGLAAVVAGVRRDPSASGVKKAARDFLQRGHEQALVAQSKGARALFVSYPKAGRTWLRYLIATYLNDVHGLGETMTLASMFRITPNWDLDPERGLPAFAYRDRPELPLVVVSHRTWRRSFEATLLPVLVKVRDPRDLMVSAYFHHTRHKGRLDAGMAAFLRRTDCGVPDFIAYTNALADGIAGRPHHVVAYEQLSRDPEATAAAVLAFIGEKANPAALSRAIDASRFAAMREAESETGIPGHDYDRADPDARRMRKGVAGGYANALSADDIAYIGRACREGLSAPARALLSATGFDG